MNIFKDRCLDDTPVKLASASNIIGFSFTYGGYEGMLLAAREALDGYGNACTTRADDALTVTRLAAMMLAIPAHEVISSLSQGASPMTLSRADTWNTLEEERNKGLYSHNNWARDDGYERAHWNPGVGIWQIDETFTETKFNHAERANTAIGGLLVAKRLRDFYCTGRTSAASHAQLKIALMKNWYGCWEEVTEEGETEVEIIVHKCYETYMKIFVPGVSSGSEPKPEALRVIQNPGSDIDGGVQDRKCRWGPSGKIFKCYLYNVDKAAGFREGYLPDRTPEGNGKDLPTPLAAPFISFTDPYTDIRYAVFPRSTALYGIHDKTIIKAAATDTNARDSKLGPNNNGWYNNTVNGKALYVTNCRMSDLTPLASLCTWENANDES